MKKITFFFLLTIIFLNNVYGKNINEQDIIINGCKDYNIYNKIVYKKLGVIENDTITSYCQFENNSKAMETMKLIYKNELLYYANKYNFEDLSEYNWKEYYKELLNDDDQLYIISKQKILAFFDIYENEDVNNNLNDLIVKYNEMNDKNKKNELLNNIFFELPLIDKTYKFENKINYTLKSSDSYNRKSGVGYAMMYAEYPNKDKYGYFSDADCTNFASQVLETGGYKKVNGVGSMFGWWYKKNGKKFSYSN